MFGIGIAELIIISMIVVGPLIIGLAVVFIVLAKQRRGETTNDHLVACPDCGRMISRSAMNCPGCGRPTR